MPKKLHFLPDEFQHAIAAVACYSAFLDYSIEHALAWALIRRKNLSVYILKQGTQGDRLLSILEATLLDEIPERSDEIKTIIGASRAARTKRNDLLHGLWGEIEEDGKLSSTHIRPHRQDRNIPMGLEEISKLSDDLAELSDQLKALGRAVHLQQQEESRARPSMLSHQPGLLSALGMDLQDTSEPPSLQQSSSGE
jgi:hypothetical protein